MRSEEDKVTQSGIEVILGGESYSVRPLVIKESREWRQQVVNLLGKVPEYTSADTSTTEGFTEALRTMLVKLPDQVADIFFSYARDLDRDKIEDVATDAEVAKAFEQVVEVAFPLAESVTKAMQRIVQ